MTKKLILSGLVLIPFITIFHMSPFIPFFRAGVQDTKLFFSAIICAGIFLSMLFNGGIKPFKNIFALLFIGLVIYSQWTFPPFTLMIHDLNEAGFWIYPPIIDILITFLAIVAVASVQYTSREIARVIDLAILCGVIMACYLVVQNLRIDQWFITLPSPYRHPIFNAHLVGTISNPTWAGAWLAMLAPLALFRKKWISLAIIIYAVSILQTTMAIVSMCFGLAVFVLYKYFMKLSTAIIVALVLVAFIGGMMYLMPDKFTDNGRFIAWKNATKDFLSSHKIMNETDNMDENTKEYVQLMNMRRYTLTGLGWGSHEYIFSRKFNTVFKRSHNEYLEILYNAGFIGLFFFLCAIGYMYRLNIDFANPTGCALMASLFVVLIGALTTTVWQVEPTRFYSILLVGLIHNKEVAKCRLE